MTEEYRIGAAHREITPPIGSQLAGFDARKGVSTGVHDDLFARAMVIERNGVQAMLISVEVISLGRAFCTRLRKEIERLTGVPAAHIVIAATHTHCGPATHHHFYNQGQALDDVYLVSLAAGVCEAAVEAFQQRAPRRLRAGFARCDQFAVNRRSLGGGPTDPLVGVLLAEELDGKPYAISVNFACHPTVLGPNMLECTGDFPFYAQQLLRESLGLAVETLYFNGAEGDLSIGHKSDLSAVGIIAPYRNFDTAKNLGEKLGRAVLESVPRLAVVEGALSVASAVAQLPLKQYAPVSEMRKARVEAGEAIVGIEPLPLEEQLPLRQRSLFARIEEYYAALYEAEPGSDPKTLAAEVAALRFGDTAIVTLPGEIFIAVALGIRASSPLPKTMFIGLANDYIGYLPSDGAEASKGYEVVASRVTGEAWRALQQSALQVLERVAAAQ
jgi:hypothetical protein